MNARFIMSNTDVAKCPAGNKPEYAFIGRSNVGKSSLINMLTQRKGLAMTSATPGKTLLINHFLIDEAWYLVDLPGYGYAQRNKTQQARLKRIITDYVLQRQQLTCLFLLIDCRHSLQANDHDFIRFLGLNQVPFALIFTKADKVGTTQLETNISTFLQQLSEEWEELPPHFVCSAHTRQGRDDILRYIASINREIISNPHKT